MTELAVNLNKTINASIEKVFNAWLDAETLSRFMKPLPGMPDVRAEIDGRVGGRFRIYMQVDDREILHHGEYLEINPYTKLVFTWVSPFSTGGSTVSICFKALGDNRTRIDLRHVKFKGEEERVSHELGWSNVLKALSDMTVIPDVQRAS